MIVAYGLPAQLVCAAQHDRVRALVGMWLLSSVCRLVLLVCVRVLVRLEGVWCYHSSLCGDSTSMFVFTFLLCSHIHIYCSVYVCRVRHPLQRSGTARATCITLSIATGSGELDASSDSV